MRTNFRALCAELLNEFEYYTDWSDAELLKAKARAALAQADEPAVLEGREPAAVTGQPSDEEVEALVARLGLIRGHANHPCGFWIDDGDAGAIARAVLARWGTPNLAETRRSLGGGEVAEKVWPPSVAASCHEAAISAVLGSPEQQLLVAAGNTIENLWQELHQTVPVAPALATEEEVAELVGEALYLVRELCDQADDLSPSHELFGLMHQAAFSLTRAAELLQRQALVPVAVSERLPGPGDCDEEGRCWCFAPQENIESSLVFHARWILSKPTSCDTHWLPAHALPLPEVNV